MKCDICNNELVTVRLINKDFCPKCTLCPKCDKNPAIISQTLGVLPCKACQRKRDKDKLGGWMSNQKVREYASTPFWKHMGLPPKPHEKKLEREMKRKNLSYADLSAARNSGKNARFNNKKLIDKALKGELQGGKQAADYGRKRPAGE